MMAWISRTDAQAIAITCGVLAGVVTALYGAYKVPIIGRPLRWIGRIIADVWRVAVADRMAWWLHRVLDSWWTAKDIEPRLAKIEAQFTNNGGSTLRDRVDATARAVGAAPAPLPGPPPIDSE